MGTVIQPLTNMSLALAFREKGTDYAVSVFFIHLIINSFQDASLKTMQQHTVLVKIISPLYDIKQNN